MRDIVKSHAFDEWMGSANARRTLYHARITTDTLLVRLRVGLVRSRCIHLHAVKKDIRYQTTGEEAEQTGGELPKQFWDHCFGFITEWASGDFKSESKSQAITAFGVEFHADDIRLMLPGPINLEKEEDHESSDKKPVPDPLLKSWWDGFSAEFDVEGMGVDDEILSAARLRFPQNKVSRERIRELVGQRKRGPKAIRDNRTA